MPVKMLFHTVSTIYVKCQKENNVQNIWLWKQSLFSVRVWIKSSCATWVCDDLPTSEQLLVHRCDYDNNDKSPLYDASGVYRTDTQELSQEGSSYVVTGNNKPRERGWAPRPSSAAPGWAADTGGHYRDKHQPEASDPELLTEQGHDNSTHIVVELFTAKRLSLDVFMYFVMSQCASVSCVQGQFNSGSAYEGKLVLKL